MFQALYSHLNLFFLENKNYIANLPVPTRPAVYKKTRFLQRARLGARCQGTPYVVNLVVVLVLGGVTVS